MITFLYPWLFALLPLPLILRKLLPPFRDPREAVRIPMFEVVVESIDAEPTKGAVVRRRNLIQTALYVFCWFAIVAALTRPQWLQPPVVRDVPTRDLLLAIDLSGSMETEDFVNVEGKKVDRLTAVKQVMDEFLAKRQGDRVAMIVFGTGAFVQIPFTQDLDVCRDLLDQTAVRMAGPKTALGDAIGLGITLFQRSELQDKVMIALTDGNDTGSKVPPAKAAKIAADDGIVIHTIGVGDPTSAGEELLDEEALKAVASETGGRYFFAADLEQLAEIYGELDRIGQREVETVSHRPKNDLFHWPLAAVVIVSLGYFGLTLIGRNTRRSIESVMADRGEAA